MDIAIATYTFLPEIGGVARNVSILAEAFAAAGHRVTVVTTAPGPSDGFGHEVVRNPGPLRLWRLTRRADVLIHSNLSLKLVYPLLFMRRPFALRHHSESAFALSRRTLSKDALRRRVFDRATHFVTSDFIGRKGGLADYVVTHPFANPRYVTPERVQPVGERRGALFVGRLEAEKGLIFLLERWPNLREALDAGTLTVVGDGALRGELERRIAAGEAGQVDYLGALPPAETAAAMGRAAYVFVPSLWQEPFGAVALEALAMGALVIHSGRGGLMEATGTLGFAFDPDDEGSLDAALARARAARDRQRAEPGERARYMAAVAEHVARFRPEIVAETILATMASIRDAKTML